MSKPVNFASTSVGNALRGFPRSASEVAPPLSERHGGRSLQSHLRHYGPGCLLGSFVEFVLQLGEPQLLARIEAVGRELVAPGALEGRAGLWHFSLRPAGQGQVETGARIVGCQR